MATRTIAVSKFIGSISLGLLTGITYTHPIHTTPTLLSLPSSASASHAFHTLLASTNRTTRLLSALSFTSILTAYILSPPRGRHPFLLYGALAAGLPHVKELYEFCVGGKTSDHTGAGGVQMRGSGNGSGSGVSSDEEWEVEASGMRSSGGKGKGRVLTPTEEEEGVNGEAVRQGIREWSRGTLYSCVSWGVGFGVMVVGMWGDGFAG